MLCILPADVTNVADRLHRHHLVHDAARVHESLAAALVRKVDDVLLGRDLTAADLAHHVRSLRTKSDRLVLGN